MISVIIPVFKASKNISKLNDELNSFFKSINQSYELIYIDDCSNDNSWEIIESFAKNNNRVIGYKLRKNFGQHNALLCGIRKARGEVIVTLDDDLQHPPKEIKKMLEKFEEGYDVIYGCASKYRHKLWRNLTSYLTKVIINTLVGYKYVTKISDFRIFKTSLRDAFFDFKGSYVNIDVLLSWSTNKFSYVNVEHHKRNEGKSNYSLKKLIFYGITMVTGFTTLPLRISSILGLIFSIFGFIILLYVIFNFFIHGSPVRGFPFLASVISLFAGIQLLVLGVIGEYLSIVHNRTSNLPSYVIEKEVKKD